MNPRANIMRTEDDATAAAAYISGQAELIATNSIVAQALAKQNPSKEFDRKFLIRRSPAHMGVRMGEHSLVRWLDGFIFFNTMNGELDRLHRKYLDMPMDPLPTLQARAMPATNQVDGRLPPPHQAAVHGFIFFNP